MVYEMSSDDWLQAELKAALSTNKSRYEELWEAIMYCTYKGRMPLKDVLRLSLSTLGTTIKILNKWGDTNDPEDD